ncbi:MAG TPA: RsmB/NOP family class I SAM-dependent RNA methyltransferase [Candidatus Ruthenibacterium merdipullorum]|nr:RsmB/NOP family class I SAM-dependent RNA methyltransferase [Candidatus Ruthenibacterium merdipullorum]
MPEQTYFEARERALLGARYDEVYRPQGEVRRALTRNALRCSEARFLQLMGPSVCRAPFCADSFYLLDETARPGKSPLYHAGAYYVQEASAAAPAPLLDVQPGQRVLDMCAAPGGKSAQLAGALGGRGLLVANEYDAARANILKSNLERMGVANAVVLNEAPARIAAALPGWFDRVLVDAPCSGEGMFRKEPQAVRQHSQALVQRCAALGAQILDAAAAALRPGGRLVYSTCTFAPEEDEAQVGAFLARHAEFSTVPCGVGFGSPGEAVRCGEHPFCAQHTRRIYPCHGGEGHFMAVLEKSAAAPWPGPGRPHAARTAPRAARAERAGRGGTAAALAFLREYFPQLGAGPDALQTFGSAVHLLAPGAFPHGTQLRVVRAGVPVGKEEKGRFEPAHALFMAYGALCENREELQPGSPLCAAWLRGEAIPAHTARAGWAAVTVAGLPLGFGKASGGMVKNRYPKGLRNLG